MRALQDAKCIQIEITNVCNMKCPNCTRFVGHHENLYFLSLKEIEKSLQSLEGFEGKIGCMGGEPTKHPYFREICKLYQQYLPKERRALWTNGLYWKEYEKTIRETFLIENIVYNAHDYEYKGQHQPLLIASKDIIKDEKLRKELIDKCWIQERWSPSINPNGAFFCEVAAAMDMLFNMGGGWEISKGWWKKEPKDFQDQVEKYCGLCSATIPFDKDIYLSNKEYLSLSTWSKLVNTSTFVLYSKEYTREDYEKNVKNWKPGIFRDFEQSEPNKRIYK